MSESIPLRSTLCIELVRVVVCDPFQQRFDTVDEFLSTKARLLWHIQGKAVVSYVLASGFDLNGRLGGKGNPYFSGTISPVLISAAAAFTRFGVKRFSRPS
jgi:hypothetical protein